MKRKNTDHKCDEFCDVKNEKELEDKYSHKNNNDEKCHTETCHCHDHHGEEERECHCHDHHREEEQECHCHDHRGEDNDCSCGCGCGHDHSKELEKNNGLTVTKYLLGAALLVVAFMPFVPTPVRVLLSVAVYVVFGIEVWRDMIGGFLKKKIFTEYTLMCVASVGAFLIGEYAEASAVMYLYSLGEMLSDTVYSRSKRNISELIALTPEYAMRLDDGNSKRVSPSDMKVGDRFIVNAGERVALDGIVEEGDADADTSSVTGEAMPLSLQKDTFCPSGSVILNGSVVLRAVTDYENSVVSKLTKAVAEASKRKARTEKRISRFARVLTPVAFGVAIIIAVVGGAVTGDVALWIRTGIALLVVSCPCSLLLSVPLTYFAGIGSAAKCGIVFRGGEFADALRDTRAAVFDKTGTLTESVLIPCNIELYVNIDKTEFEALAADVLKHSPHAAAQSFCTAYPSDENLKIEKVEIIGGRGIVCEVDGKRTLFGNAALMRDNGIDIADSRTTAIFGAEDGVLLGRIDFRSVIKADVKDTLRQLRRMGVERIAVISGDGEDAVKEVCDELDIKEYYYSVAPHGKAELLEKIIKEERAKNKKNKVLYCGDGLNDSAVISMADIGVAMGKEGAALTVESADVVLTDDSIGRLCDALRTSKRVSRIVTQNIIISLGMKLAVLVTGMILSSLGLKIPLGMAVAADVGATLVAVLNSVRAYGKEKL